MTYPTFLSVSYSYYTLQLLFRLIIELRLLVVAVFLFFDTASILAQSSDTEIPDSTKYGTVVLEFNTDSALVIVNNQFDDALFIKSGDSVHVKAGKTSVKLSVIHDYLFEEIFDLKEDSLVTVRHEFEYLPLTKELLTGNIAARKYYDANLLVISDEDSDIYLNDELVGNEFAFINASTGNNLIQVKSSSIYQSLYIKNVKTTFNSDYSFKIVERHIKPLESTSKKLAFLPGFSQAYKYQPLKALFIRGSIGLLFTSVSTFGIKYRLDKNEYDDLLDRYNNSISDTEVTALGDQLIEKEKSLKSTAFLRNASLISFSAIYIYNILDGFYSKPKIGYREKKPFSFYLSSNELASLSLNLNIKLDN